MTGLRAPVRAVTFDLDFTLWDLSGVIERAEEIAQAFLDRHFPNVTKAWTTEGLRELRQRVADDNEHLRYDVTGLRKRVLREAGRGAGYEGAVLDALVEETFRAFLDARHDVVFFEDALPVLERLHGRVSLGAITNGNADLERLRLRHFFDFSVSAMEIGAAKPSHLVFEAAVNRAGVPAEAIIHVGDDAETDVTGAARFGMQAVWLNRAAVMWPNELEPVAHLQVRSLAELDERLERLLAGDGGRNG